MKKINALECVVVLAIGMFLKCWTLYACLSRVFASGFKNAEALLLVFVLEALNFVLKSIIAMLIIIGRPT